MAREDAKILIVDDNDDNRFLLCRVLSSDGYTNIVTASNGIEAIYELNKGSCDLVLLDIMMPDMNGYQVLEEMKKNESLCDIPVIMISAVDETKSVIRCIELGADDVLHKPFVPGVVLARIRNLLGRSEAERRRREVAVLEASLAEQQRNAAALQAAIDRLTVANTELERFNIIAAHDLREPVRSVSLFAQMLERSCHSKLNADERQYLEYLVTGAKRIYDMVGGLLTYTNITRNVSQLHQVSATAVCRIALENLALLTKESGAEIVVGPLPEVTADEVLLVQILQHLISNALRFRHPARRPYIEVMAQRDGDMWRFSVADNGIGFDARTDDVFELFHLQPTDQRSGIGVGLAICKRIVLWLGGTMWAESTPDKGSTISFTIPARP